MGDGQLGTATQTPIPTPRSHSPIAAKTRIPKFGRDLTYHRPTCDLFLVGARSGALAPRFTMTLKTPSPKTPPNPPPPSSQQSSEIYRLNLDQGRFLKPYEAVGASSLNVCAINPHNGLLGVGSEEGRVHCFDPRIRDAVGTVDVAAGLASLRDE